MPYTESTCSHCGEPNDRHGPPYTCEQCRVQICAACAGGFGYDQIHEATCRPLRMPRPGFLDEEITYVCTCGSEPRVRACADCLATKIRKYACFGCDEPRGATGVCAMCFNYYYCSARCALKDRHAETCAATRYIRCGHGNSVTLKPVCGCTMCAHGKWDRDCYLCIAESRLRRDGCAAPPGSC